MTLDREKTPCMAFTNRGLHWREKHALIWIYTHYPSVQAVLNLSICNADLSKLYGYCMHLLL